MINGKLLPLQQLDQVVKLRNSKGYIMMKIYLTVENLNAFIIHIP